MSYFNMSNIVTVGNGHNIPVIGYGHASLPNSLSLNNVGQHLQWCYHSFSSLWDPLSHIILKQLIQFSLQGCNSKELILGLDKCKLYLFLCISFFALIYSFCLYFLNNLRFLYKFVYFVY